MLAAEVLVAHHDDLRALLRRLGRPAAGEERRGLLTELVAELSMHEQLEDEIYYPAVAHLCALVPIAHAEHRQMNDQLAALLRVDPAGPRFGPELAALTAAIEHHAGKEEREMFPEAAAKLDEGAQHELGGRLAARLDQLRASRLTRLRLQAKAAVLRRL